MHHSHDLPQSRHRQQGNGAVRAEGSCTREYGQFIPCIAQLSIGLYQYAYHLPVDVIAEEVVRLHLAQRHFDVIIAAQAVLGHLEKCRSCSKGRNGRLLSIM